MVEMEVSGNARGAHVLVLPYPAQGHINPMLQFAKRLYHKGLRVSLVATVFLARSMEAETGYISLEFISDGCDEGGYKQAGSIEAHLERFKKIGSQSLRDLIQKLGNSGRPVDCLVYDSCLPWALDVAKQAGIQGGSFFTLSCAVEAIYYNVYTGRLSVPVPVEIVSLPGLPELLLSELPSYVSNPDYRPALLEFAKEQFINIQKADWVFCCTADQLEREEVKSLKSNMPLKSIGPMIPSWYVDQRVEDDQDYGVSLWKKNGACKEWLDSKDDGSVVYVSFGSIVSLGPLKMEETAGVLKESSHYFLWVVRESEESNLPEKFAEESKEKGIVVRWCSQLEVLSHRAVGCFVTHCGWNSTLEALTLGVPMVACPQGCDQPTNAKYIEEVWRVGVRAKIDDEGIIRREELKKCIKEIMEGERGVEIKRNALKWRKLAKEALEEGGSSDQNIEEFVTVISG
ncbi:mogroside IE synthase-like [Aristolochia californica]|uniref:mogroside IE synthase-like n=1 Tax=Aristolochia californica TaxID=171875 RepID=UPI0035DEC886